MPFSLDHGSCRPTRFALIGCLALATNCSPTLAQDHRSWSCDTANGKYDEQVLPIPSKSTTISGQIRFNKADFSGEWNSLAKISFMQTASGDGNCHCSGISVYAFPSPDTLEFRLTANGQDVGVARSRFGVPITFKITIDPHGVMSVGIGKSDPAIQVVTLLHPGHDTMAMSCSGADVSFLNVDVR